MPRPSIILDCDPGHDDFVAILLAYRHADLLGITTVAGNSPLSNTTRNALIAREMFGVDVPIHSGAARPLLAPQHAAEHIHGASGLGGPVLPTITGTADSTDAVAFIRDATLRTPGVWITAVGPLTNVALALRADPTLAERIAGISVMGGGSFGNRTAVAEFNIWADPEAAAIVFESGVRLIMSGLDATHQFLFDTDDEAKVRGLGTTRSTFMAEILHHFATAYSEVYTGWTKGGPLHDPCAVLAVTHPELLRFSDHHVTIETAGKHTRGMTVIDQREISTGEPANCRVAVGIDVPRAKSLIHDVLASYR
jgi:inosine-uridine nucleoside N-ribohydrolase